jgi:amino acid transporter
MSIARFLLGRPLADDDSGRRKLTSFEGLPAMGLDALGSASYGPEAILTALLPLGIVGLVYLGPLMLAILALLGILYLSYRQIVRAYPNGGGAYVVARENLGTHVSLLAATALMIDYVLNVAVGISAGVGALTSALPLLHPYTVPLCLMMLLAITLINLRGTFDAGRLFALPTYVFVGGLLAVIAIGIYRSLMSGGDPSAVVAPAALPAATAVLGPFLLLQAFSAGCSAMTGVEAVSNGVTAFREPVVKRANFTLAAICGILGLLLAGIGYLARTYGVSAMDQTQPGYQSVISQLTAAIVGRGPLYYVVIASVLSVLCLSANTSFVGFPRLCRVVAQDDFLPRPFAVLGRRLVFSVGIFYLTASAALLLVFFHGITDRLIPLFAVGAFLTFTLSQLSMVIHWRRVLRSAPEQASRARTSLFINLIGAAATLTALGIMIVAKFSEGAWITLIVIPAIVITLKAVKKYYQHVNKQLHADSIFEVEWSKPPLILVPIEGWNRLTKCALQFALKLSSDVVAVHVDEEVGPNDESPALDRKWSEQVIEPVTAAGMKPPELRRLHAPHRRIQRPLLDLIGAMQNKHPNRTIAIVIPQLIERRWYQFFLHTQRTRRLRQTLLARGGSRVVVIDMPWEVKESG